MRTGDLLDGRFEVGQLAGSGGVGHVYRSRDLWTGRFVALKVLKPSSNREIERFSREVRVLAKLHHPSIVRYVAHGTTECGEPYLAMEWLDGEDLAERLGRQRFSLIESLDLVRRAAIAVGVAHEHRIVHRDIKPSNLFLRDGHLEDLKVLDFGLARLADASQDLTRTGLVVGTLGFMAPEQAAGDRAVDARADVFALGCVLYRCVTQRPAFEGDRVGTVLMKILHEDPTRMSACVDAVPQELDDLVARMLAKDPAVRPADGAAVAAELGSLLDAMPTPPPMSIRMTAPPSSLTHAERRFVCFVTVRTPRSWVAPAAPEIQTVFDMEPEEREQVRAAAAQHGGQLEALADGSLLIALSSGASATDLASQGARCALAVRALFADAPIAVTMGRSDQKSGRFLSAAVDLAAALLDDGDRTYNGEPRVIRIDATAAGLLDAGFDVGGDERGLILKGERVVEKPRLLLGRPTPFVGRRRELAALRAIYEECLGESVARVALVTGPPGKGKSRLRRELLHAQVEARDSNAEVWTGTAQPVAAGASFSTIASLVRSAARFALDEPPGLRRQKLLARFQRHLGESAAARVAALLGEISGAPFPEEGVPGVDLRSARCSATVLAEQARLAWLDLLAAECDAGPLVLVLEDLHWADQASVGLVSAAVRRLHDRPLLVMGFGRPETLELFPALVRDPAAHELRLRGLSARACEQLVRAVVGDALSGPIVEKLVERSGGNPFYLEELLRAEMTGQKDELPDTVLAMVQARLSTLEPGARRLLRAASVFGTRFCMSGVRALLGEEASRSDVDHWVAQLIEAELIEPSSGAREADGDFSFRHWIVRQAIYETLADHDLRVGHRLAAEWLSRESAGDAATIERHETLGGLVRAAAIT